MTSAPAADQVRLLEVQALDTKAAQLAHARVSHPALATVTELAGRLAELEEQLVTARTAVSDTRREVSKAETDVEQVRSRAVRDQSRLDSGAVSVKDVQALSSELEALARRQSDLEDAELEVLERLEQQEAVLTRAERTREELVEQHRRVAAELEGALAELDEQADRFAADRAERAAGLDADLVALYDKLRAHLGGLGVAPLRGRRCEGCQLELNSSELARIMAAPPDEVLRCEECGRILVRVDIAG